VNKELPDRKEIHKLGKKWQDFLATILCNVKGGRKVKQNEDEEQRTLNYKDLIKSSRTFLGFT
jgi:hypothetical protein